MKNIKENPKFFLAILTLILILIIVFTGVYEVEAGNIGVVTRFGAVNRVAYPGINFKLPFIEKVVPLSIRTQKDEVPATAMSENLQVVTSLIAVNYHLDGSRAEEVYQNVGSNLQRSSSLRPFRTLSKR